MDKDNNTILKVASFNYRGIKSSLFDVQSLCESFHVILLQETWLPRQSLSFLDSINTNFFAHGHSTMDLAEKIAVGRPYGGLAILWHKSLKSDIIYNYDHSIMGIKVDVGGSFLTLINVYLPYCSAENEDKFIEELGKLNAFCDEIGSSNICLIGDFNSSPTNKFGPLLKEFSKDNDLCHSDELLLSEGSYTFISGAHLSCTWIDHCLCSL